MKQPGTLRRLHVMNTDIFRTDERKRFFTAEPCQKGKHTIQPQGRNRAGKIFILLFKSRKVTRTHGDFHTDTPDFSDVVYNHPRRVFGGENHGLSFAHQNVSDRFTLDSECHQAAQKVPMGEHIAGTKGKVTAAHGRFGTFLLGKPRRVHTQKRPSGIGISAVKTVVKEADFPQGFFCQRPLMLVKNADELCGGLPVAVLGKITKAGKKNFLLPGEILSQK